MGCGSVCLTAMCQWWAVGILVSGLCIAPPAFTFLSGRDHSTLLPGLNRLQVWYSDPYFVVSIAYDRTCKIVEYNAIQFWKVVCTDFKSDEGPLYSRQWRLCVEGQNFPPS